MIYNFLYSRSKNVADVDESFQEAWLRVHKYVLSFDAEQNAVAWVLSIARNTLIDLLHKKSKAGFPIKNLPEVGDNSAAKNEARLIVEDILNGLGEKDARLIRERYLEEKDYDEIAKSVNLTEANTRQKISRLVRKLRSGG